MTSNPLYKRGKRMKKITLITIAALVFVGVAYAALDATLLQNAVMLAPQATQSEHEQTELFAATNRTTSLTATGTVKANADFYGKGTIVLVFSGNDDVAYSNQAFLVTGTNAALSGTTVETLIGEHDDDDLDIQAVEVNLDTLAGTHFAVKFVSVTDNSEPMRFGADLVHGKIPTALQTINSPAVDKMPFTGVANIVVAVAPPVKGATNYTAAVQIQHATASTGTWSNVTGRTATVTGASGGIATIPYDMTGGNRYLRAVVTTTNDVGAVSITVNSFK
jgi:hypothetical protein